MALRKNPTNTSAPAFEEDDGSDTATAVATAEAKPVQAEASRAVTQASTTAVAAPKMGYTAALQDLHLQIDLDTVRSLGVGTLPKLVADRAGFEIGSGNDKQEMGNWIDFKVVSYNDRWLVTAGVEGEEGTALLRTSYDGQTLEEEEMSVKEYLDYLRREGYSKASLRHYNDLYGFIVRSEKGGKAAEGNVDLIQLQLSPTSAKAWKAYLVQAGVNARYTGKPATDTVRATIARREYNGNKFAAIAFSAA